MTDIALFEEPEVEGLQSAVGALYFPHIALPPTPNPGALQTITENVLRARVDVWNN